MSELRVAPINQEHVSIEFDHELLTILEERDLKPTVIELYNITSIKHGDEDNGYVVAKIEHLTKPFEDADVLEDTTHTWLCGCEGHWHHYYDQELGVVDGTCKHVDKVQHKYEHDGADQRTLIE